MTTSIPIEQAVEHVVTTKRWDTFGIAPQFVEFIEQSWQHDELSVLARKI